MLPFHVNAFLNRKWPISTKFDYVLPVSLCFFTAASSNDQELMKRFYVIIHLYDIEGFGVEEPHLTFKIS